MVIIEDRSSCMPWGRLTELRMSRSVGLGASVRGEKNKEASKFRQAMCNFSRCAPERLRRGS